MLAGVGAAGPQLAQLFAHGVHLVQHRVLGAGLGQLGAQHSGHFLVVAVQPAAGHFQGLDVALTQAGGVQLCLASAAHFAGKVGHHLVTVGNDGFQRLLVGHGLDHAQHHLRAGFAHFGEAHHFHATDVQPANVKFIRLDRQLGRRGVGVVVVVQFFTADQDAPRRHVGAGIHRFKVAVAPVVAQAIDDARSGDGNPGHLHSPNGDTNRTEQRHVDDEHQPHALPGKTGVQVALDPVVGCAVAVAGQGVEVFALCAVQLGAFGQHFFDAKHHGAVGVAFVLAFGVVLAVHRSPFFGDLARGQPQPKTEKVRRNCVQLQ